MRYALHFTAALLAAALGAGGASAQDDTQGPSPAPGLAPLCTDRPAKSSGACTVDPGHFQYESELFNGTFQRQGGVTTDTYLVTSPTLKYGLTSNLDVEATITPYEFVRTHDKFGNDDTLGGFGDIYFRVKYRPYQSADGKVQLALFPFVKAPTARSGIGNGEVEGGLTIPASYQLTQKLSVGTTPEFDDYADAVGAGRHFNMAQVVTLAYAVPHNVTLYGEVYGDWNYDPTGTVRQYSADVAASWLMTPTFQLDAGLNFGLNAATPGVQAYLGASQKF